jgi:ribosomal protein L32
MAEESNKTELISSSDKTEAVQMILCPRCGQYKPAHHIDRHLCVDCVKAENNRITYYRQHQEDWVNNAKDNGLELWEQQPGETQWEFTVWTAYRDSYPGKKPSYSGVARQLNTTYSSVRKIAQRWSFPVRMQAWMKYCDTITLAQRCQEILDMNRDHVDMAAKIRDKLNTAIELIDPMALKPGEIASLARLASDMERKARIDTIAQEEIRRELVVDTENPELKKAPTKQSDLSEVVGILLKAGALGDITQIGVKQTETKTTTTQVVVQDEEGNISGIEMKE